MQPLVKGARHAESQAKRTDSNNCNLENAAAESNQVAGRSIKRGTAKAKEGDEPMEVQAPHNLGRHQLRGRPE